MKNFYCVILTFLSVCLYANSNIKYNQKTWSQGDIFITCRLEKQIFTELEPVLLKIIFLNNSLEDISLVRWNKLKDFEYSIVRQESGEMVPLTLRGKQYEAQDLFSQAEVLIGSGETYVYHFSLSSFYDLTLSGEYLLSMKGSFFGKNRKRIDFQIKDLVFEITDVTDIDKNK